jgi:uroporphyrin-III C-methyltransferase / precorrin-2 dehydrogenase / sirohydrochlorin ferrochelatase
MIASMSDPRSSTVTVNPSDFVGVTLVGGGPGDPDLITVAGLRALLAADVVVADRLAPLDLLKELDPDVEVIDVAKVPRGPSTSQERINSLLVERARAGQNVVRLKGGDGYVFGRGYEEVMACQEAGIPVRVLPGVTSALAVPALAGIPITHRGVVHEFTVVSGHLPPGHPDSLTNWDAVAQLNGTLVLMMAVENAGRIADVLLAAGRSADLPAAVIQDGSLPTERHLETTLASLAHDMARAHIRPPAVIVIGAVAETARTRRQGSVSPPLPAE